LDFFVCGLTSFGFDHNFDHNANDFIWSIASANPLNWIPDIQPLDFENDMYPIFWI